MVAPKKYVHALIPGKCSSKSEAEGDLTWTEGSNVTQGGRDWSDMSTSQEIPRATRS